MSDYVETRLVMGLEFNPETFTRPFRVKMNEETITQKRFCSATGRRLADEKLITQHEGVKFVYGDKVFNSGDEYEDMCELCEYIAEEFSGFEYYQAYGFYDLDSGPDEESTRHFFVPCKTNESHAWIANQLPKKCEAIKNRLQKAGFKGLKKVAVAASVS